MLFRSEGVTTVEIKSGYGLDTPSEIRCLEVGRRLGDLLPIDIVTTFLGAHSVPPEYAGDADAYVGDPTSAAWSGESKAIYMVAIDSGQVLAKLKFDATGTNGPS